MKARLVRSSEFGPKQEMAFSVTGTVAIPSPIPATGEVSALLVVQDTQDKKEQSNLNFKTLLKSVQVVNQQCVVTRIVAYDSVRAVAFYSDGDKEARDGEWTVVPASRLAPMLAPALQALKEVDKERGGTFEFPLFERAVLYVSESASILHRVEFGLTAAVSAEAPLPLLSGHERPCCCDFEHPCCCDYEHPCCCDYEHPCCCDFEHPCCCDFEHPCCCDKGRR
ncbi:MAG: hypothetical protein ACLQIB_09210 [Isosphaeraceae bacterium]